MEPKISKNIFRKNSNQGKNIKPTKKTKKKIPKIFKNIYRAKLYNYVTKNGKKQTAEKQIAESIKQLQALQKRNSNKITELSLLHILQTFRLIQLKNKKRKKKLTREIPGFLSSHHYRLFWGIKHFVKTAVSNQQQKKFALKLNDEILTISKGENKAIELKNEYQEKITKEKKLFKFYRW